MRNVMLIMAFSLFVCFMANEANAQDYTLQSGRMTVGAGGFVGESVGGTYKASGIVGQLAIGIDSATSIASGDAYVAHSGFWVFDDPSSGINEEPNAGRGVKNYPNPASNHTTFDFDLESGAYVTLRVFDVMGAVVATVVADEYREGGPQTIEWTIRNSFGTEFASGSYNYELTVNPISSGNSSRGYSIRNILMIAK